MYPSDYISPTGYISHNTGSLWPQRLFARSRGHVSFEASAYLGHRQHYNGQEFDECRLVANHGQISINELAGKALLSKLRSELSTTNCKRWNCISSKDIASTRSLRKLAKHSATSETTTTAPSKDFAPISSLEKRTRSERIVHNSSMREPSR